MSNCVIACALLIFHLSHTEFSSILESRRLLVILSTINCDNTEQQCFEAEACLNVHIWPDLGSKAINYIWQVGWPLVSQLKEVQSQCSRSCVKPCVSLTTNQTKDVLIAAPSKQPDHQHLLQSHFHQHSKHIPTAQTVHTLHKNVQISKKVQIRLARELNAKRPMTSGIMRKKL